MLCDEGWFEVFERVLAAASSSPHAAQALEAWLPKASGLRERIQQIAGAHPGGFRPSLGSGELLDDVDFDVAALQLERHRTLQRARRKLRAVFRFTQLGAHARARKEQADGAADAAELPEAEAPEAEQATGDA